MSLQSELPLFPPSIETVECCGDEFLALCERVGKEGRCIAIAEVKGVSRWRCTIATRPPPIGNYHSSHEKAHHFNN